MNSVHLCSSCLHFHCLDIHSGALNLSRKAWRKAQKMWRMLERRKKLEGGTERDKKIQYLHYNIRSTITVIYACVWFALCFVRLDRQTDEVKGFELSYPSSTLSYIYSKHTQPTYLNLFHYDENCKNNSNLIIKSVLCGDDNLCIK